MRRWAAVAAIVSALVALAGCGAGSSRDHRGRSPRSRATTRSVSMRPRHARTCRSRAFGGMWSPAGQGATWN